MLLTGPVKSREQHDDEEAVVDGMGASSLSPYASEELGIVTVFILVLFSLLLLFVLLPRNNPGRKSACIANANAGRTLQQMFIMGGTCK